MDGFELSTVINRPIEEVFGCLANLENDINPTEYEVTEYEPNRIAAWQTVPGPLPLTFRRTFERVEGGTRVTIRYEAELRGFF